MGGSFRVFWILAFIILAGLTVSPVSAVDFIAHRTVLVGRRGFCNSRLYGAIEAQKS